MKKRNTLDMTQGSLTKKLILFSLPLILNKILDICYNLADKMMLGQFVGDDAMAAVGVTGTPFNLFFNLFAGFSLGVLVCCGNHLGAHNRGGLERCMHTSLVVAAILGVFVTTTGILTSRPLLELMGVPGELMADALLYFRIRFLSTLFMICSSFESNIMIAHGDTRRITIINAISGLANVGLNYFFLRIVPLGVAGVALATLISGLIPFIYKTVVLFSPRDNYRLRFRALRIHKKHARQILSVGIPNGLNSTMFSISNMLLQSTVNSFGSVYITANTCADAVADFINIAYAGFPSACVAAMAQCHGAHAFDRMKQVIRKTFLICEAGIAALILPVLLLARPLLGLFTNTDAVVTAAIPKLHFYCMGYLVYTFLQVYMSGLKGLKKSGVAFAANAMGVCLPRVLWVLLVMPVFNDPNILYMIYPISWLIVSVIMGIAYHYYYNKIRRREALPATSSQ